MKQELLALLTASITCTGSAGGWSWSQCDKNTPEGPAEVASEPGPSLVSFAGTQDLGCSSPLVCPGSQLGFLASEGEDKHRFFPTRGWVFLWHIKSRSSPGLHCPFPAPIHTPEFVTMTQGQERRQQVLPRAPGQLLHAQGCPGWGLELLCPAGVQPPGVEPLPLL